MSRQRRLLASAVALVALTAAFAGSTAVFNSTYKQQAEVDARLTNGADVTVTESPGARVGPARRRPARRGPGRRAASSRSSTASPTSAPTCRTSTACGRTTIGAAGKLQDAWFQGGSATQPDGAARRQARLGARVRRDRQGLPAAPGRPAAAAPPGRAHQAVPRRCPFHYVGRGQGVPHRADATRSSWPTRATSPGDRQRRRRRLPRADRRHEPRRRRAAACARRVGTGAQVTDIAAPAQGRRLEPDRGRAVRSDQGRARLRARARRGRLGPGARPRASRSAGARSRSPARSGAKARQLGGFVWGESLFVTAGGLVLGPSPPPAISEMLVEGPDRRLRPAARRARRALGLPGQRRRCSPSAPSAWRAPRPCARCGDRPSRSCATCELRPGGNRRCCPGVDPARVARRPRLRDCVRMRPASRASRRSPSCSSRTTGTGT